MSLPLLLGLAHGISDAAAGMLVMRVIMLNIPSGGILILLYNGLAFGLQPVAGLLLDSLDRPRWGAALGLILTAGGVTAMEHSQPFGMMLAGCGSALLHAGGGGLAIQSTPGKAAGPGVFAAFGVIGLAVGSQLAFVDSLAVNAGLVIVLAGLAVLVGLWRTPAPQTTSHSQDLSVIFMRAEWIAVLALLAGVALRSYAWTGNSTAVQAQSQAALGLAIAAGAGKLLGGFLADRLGWLKFAVGALAWAALCLAAGMGQFALTAAGVFFLQSITGLSLAAMGQRLPRTPAFAASLVLGTGVIAGGLPYMAVSGGWYGAGIMTAALALSAGAYILGIRTRPTNL